MKMRFIAVGLTIVISIGIFGMNVNAEEMTASEQTPTDAYEEEFEDCEANGIVYDLNQMDTFKNRTLEETADRYWEAKNAGPSYVSNKSETYYKVQPSFEAPYEPGVLHEDTIAVMAATTNYYRWLCGIKPLTWTSSSELQAGAFVRTFSFGHVVDNSKKPADMSDELWNMGANASHNIVAYGITPYGAIYAWMNEGYSLGKKEWDWGGASIGHRIMLIGAPKMGFGYSGGVGIGVMLSGDSGGSYEGFSAYPCPGAMPNDLIMPQSAAWSIFFDFSKVYFPDESKAEVTITNLDTGEKWIRNKYTNMTSADNDMQLSSSSICFIQPDDYNRKTNRYENSYEVVISGMKDKATGRQAQIKYRVDFKDVKVYGASNASALAMPYSSYVIDMNPDNEDDILKKLQTTLPKEVVFEAENGCTYTAPVSGEWVLDKANQCWTNSVDESDLPDRITDTNGVLKKITFKYVFKTDTCWFGMRDRNPYVGTSGTMMASLSRYVNHSKVYQINQDEYGQYNATERFDSDTSEDLKIELEYTSFTHTYIFNSFKKSDTGEYCSVLYNDKEKNSAAIVPRTINLKVTEEGASPDATGIYTAKSDHTGETLGLVFDGAPKSECEFSWWAMKDDGQNWIKIQDWTRGSEWLNWTPEEYGDYVVVGKVRYDKDDSTISQAVTNISYHPAIKGICQMPYTGEGGGYLIGIESYENPDRAYRYEMLILDCTLLAQGKDAWIYTTGQCYAPDTCLWTIWQPLYGYYWTLFRIYDENGELIDQQCFGFENIC